jgi:hypothetical protein
MIPMGFYGDCSHYIELPKPDNIVDYEMYKTPFWVVTKKEDIKENNSQSKFIL